MTAPRFFVTESAIDRAAGMVRIEDSVQVHQIRKVLRLTTGDSLLVLDGGGSIYSCEIAGAARGEILARIRSRAEASGEPPVSIEVAMPLIRGERFDWALQKLTELGASVVVPVKSSRSVVRSAGSGRMARWAAILREAAEQCERAAIPRIVEPCSIEDFVRGRAGQPRLKYVCAERRLSPELWRLLEADRAMPPPPVSVVIGPEGGLAPGELDEAVAAGFQPVSLGRRILRSETAALYAVSLIVTALAGPDGP